MTIDPSFFLQHLKEPRCVGFGEIGLDYTTTCRCFSHRGKNEKKDCVKRKIRKQVEFLEHMLPLIPEDVVIVVHTNGEGAANDMIEIRIKGRKTKQGIHWHCFMGDSSLANRLLQTFPCLFLSFSSGSMEDHETRNSLLHVPSSHLLLKSDAPYLDVFKRKLNSPWAIVGHAKEIASIKNLPLSTLLEITLQNAVKLYHIPFIPCVVNSPSSVPRVYFNGPRCELSNMFPCKLMFRGRPFCSSEQAYQFQRAQDIGDHEVVEDLLECHDGFAAKIISRNLDEASCKEWNIQSSVSVMKELLEQKFWQVPQFQSYLLNSAQSYLMEATRDVFWGIGLKRDEAAQCAIDQLPGHNVLGWLLMALRDDQSGRGAKHLITLYQANRNIPFYEGIVFLYGREPVNRD